ncbi:MAG: DNA-processing protein DprA [Tissierellia bacterium]|nr:DNA-processing protein DprA [Tissierellia bacterium]
MENLNINQKTLLWLSANGVSNNKISKLLEYFGSPENLWENFVSEKHNLSFLKTDAIEELSENKNNFVEERLMKKLKIEKAEIVTIFDEEYPAKLKQIQGAPYLLYYKGNLDFINNISIAVIGSRKATSYGKWAAEKLTKELSEVGVNIVSGLAVGIDTIAHKTALKYNSKTFGIIGCGINVVYPKNNLELFKQISGNNGAVITEYPFDIQPVAFNFHDRNRIISGLSEGVLVIEAQEKSGTLITAGHAANQGREIFAVPGNIDSLYSKGTNALIRDGAKITVSIDDIIEEILELKERVKLQNAFIDLSTLTDDEIRIMDSLKSGKNTVEELRQEIKMETGELLGNLTLLEMKGAIKVSTDKISLNI